MRKIAYSRKKNIYKKRITISKMRASSSSDINKFIQSYIYRRVMTVQIYLKRILLFKKDTHFIQTSK